MEQIKEEFMGEQEATVYLAVTGARLSGILAIWVVMQDGECIAIGEDYSTKSDANGLVETKKLNAYIANRSAVSFSVVGFEVITFDRLASPLPDNITSVSICLNERNSKWAAWEQEITEVKRMVLALAGEYKYCQRACKMIASNNMESLLKMERGITPNMERAQWMKKFKQISKNKATRQQQAAKQFESWRGLLDKRGQAEVTKTGEPWVVATDGSYRNLGRFRSLGSYAWVGHNGAHGRGELDFCNDSNLAEVAAIFFALVAAPKDASEIQIITDSEAAICLIEGRGIGHFASVNKAVKLIHKAMAGYEVTFQWVKGHQDHPLNVAADKLASYKNQQTEAQRLELVHQAMQAHSELNFDDSEINLSL